MRIIVADHPQLKEHLKRAKRSYIKEFSLSDEEYDRWAKEARDQHPEDGEETVFVRVALRHLCATLPEENPVQPKALTQIEFRRWAVGIILLLLFLCVRSFGQAGLDGVKVFDGSNVLVKSWTGGFANLKCGTGVTCSFASPYMTLAVSSGSGDVTGPSSSVDSEIALFSGVTGKVIKRASLSGVIKATSGVIGQAAYTDVVALWASGSCTGLLKSDGTCDNSTYVTTARNLTAGAGLSGGGTLASDRTFATDSTEADFLASGALTCGAATQGKIKVHTTPLQYCDNAATPALQYAAYGDSAGKATLGDSATAFFSAGILESTIGGTANGFTKFTGPAASEKTFTLPNASTTILTTNDSTGTGTTAVLKSGAVILPKTIGGVRWVDSANSAGWSGSDVGAWVNAAFTDCSNWCEVHIAKATYTQTTVISVPVGNSQPTKLVCENGTELDYTGSSDAIQVYGTGQSAALVTLEGCKQVGTSSGLSGVHMHAFNHMLFIDWFIRDFTAGDCVQNEGVNEVSVYGGEFSVCKIGWHNKSYFSGSRFDPNAVKFFGSQFQVNSQWGYWDDATPAISSQSALGNGFFGTTFFNNGTTTTAATVAADNATCALAGACRNAGGTVATYITSAAHGLVVGELVNVASVTDTTFNGLCVVSVLVSATSFSCPNTGTASAHSGTGTTREVNGHVFVQLGTNFLASGSYFEYSSAIASPLCGIVIGDNTYQPKTTKFDSSVFSLVGVVSSVCIGNGLGTTISNNTENATVTNFLNNIGTGGRQLTWDSNSATGATNLFTGTDGGLDNIYTNLGGFTQIESVQHQVTGNLARVTGSDFTTSGVGTALENITGLTWTLRANTAQNVSFHCDLAYHQNTAAVAVSFGIKAANLNPTNIFATGIQYTSATASTEGVLATLATTTATNIVTATPSAITTDWVVHLAGMIENPSGVANTVTIMVKTATAGDTVTVKRGSWCRIN